METNTEAVMCANCGMAIAPGMAEASMERDGEQFHFDTEGCRDAFAERPAEDAHHRSL